MRFVVFILNVFIVTIVARSLKESNVQPIDEKKLVADDSPKQAELKNVKDQNDDSDFLYLWTIAGPVVGFIIILAIIISVFIASKSTASDIKKGSYDVNTVKSQPGEVEKYTDYNGPSSFSETISLPSQTDGSVSQGEESFNDENSNISQLPKTLAKKGMGREVVDDEDALDEISFQ